jgi:hypothetical protein
LQNIFINILLVAIIITLFACDSGPLTPQDIVFPQKDISYNKHLQPMFDLSCCNSGCHGDSKAGGVNLTSYINLFQTAGLVSPGDSINSTLSQIMSEKLPHSYILIRDITTLNQRQGVTLWIKEGARNN